MYQQLFEKACGMFNILHYITIALFFAILLLCLYFSRNLTRLQAQETLRWITVAVILAEIVKISMRIQQGLAPDSWMPLYYCSLFLYALCLIWLPWRPLKRAGYAYMTMGGIFAGVVFTLYPSTSLGMYPLLSAPVIHSFFYHMVMCYSGIMVLWKGVFRPVKRDSISYFAVVFLACAVSIPLNHWLGTNCMFLRHPFGLAVLQPILEFSPAVYMTVVTLGQACAVFWINYGIFVVARKYIRRAAVKGR